MRKNAKRDHEITKRGVNKRSNKTFYDSGFEFKYSKTPTIFSFLRDINKTIGFFELLNHTHNSTKKPKHFIDMKDVEDLTMETVLYLLSIINIWKKKRHKFKLQIQAPNNEELKSLLSKSGLHKYLKGDADGVFEENIYPMCDGGLETIDNSNTISTNERCISISEYSTKMLSSNGEVDSKSLQRKVFYQTNAIAEMIRNTDDHAYNKTPSELMPLRNWYFFAAKVKDGISCYFLDNGKGIISTTKKDIIDRVFLGLKNFEPKLLKEVMNGKFRSRTKKPYRNKGLPEIKEFFENPFIRIATIITNNTIYRNDNGTITYEKINKEFKGTLYIWILKEEYLAKNNNSESF